MPPYHALILAIWSQDATYCLQVYNVGLNELYRQTAIASRHRARYAATQLHNVLEPDCGYLSYAYHWSVVGSVLDSVWRGYVELLEHIREADGGAVRREMVMMQREMSANQRQTDQAVARLAQETARKKELQERFDYLVKEGEAQLKLLSHVPIRRSLPLSNHFIICFSQSRLLGRTVLLI